MIYKFQKAHSELEIELSKAEDDDCYDTVMFSVRYNDEPNWITSSLVKEDIYHLIGVLHLLHKQMN